MSGSFYEREKRGLIDDSMVLDAYLFAGNDDRTPISAVNITSVTFTVMTPTDPPGSPSVNGAAGTVPDDGHGQYVVSGAVNVIDGHYRAIATFHYTDGTLTGLTKSVPVNYEITDPFLATGTNPADGAVDMVWKKIEDCFDSELGGPWLRDMTLSIFDKYKVRDFLPVALLAINQQMPFTEYTEDSFPYDANDGTALMGMALWMETVRHLMRSYTEQPDIPNSPVAWESRQKYQQAWNAIYQLENPLFERWLTRWKLRSYDLSHSSMLVGYKSGRLMPANLRTRGVLRGFF